jgi:hypothetical protein
MPKKNARSYLKLAEFRTRLKKNQSKTYFVVYDKEHFSFLADEEKFGSIDYPLSEWEKFPDVAMRFATADAAIQYWNSASFLYKPGTASVYEVSVPSLNELVLSQVCKLEGNWREEIDSHEISQIPGNLI